MHFGRVGTNTTDTAHDKLLLLLFFPPHNDDDGGNDGLNRVRGEKEREKTEMNILYRVDYSETAHLFQNYVTS